MNTATHRYLEYTVLTVLFWVGIWGSIVLVMDRFIHSFHTRLLTFFLMITISFTLLDRWGHIQYNDDPIPPANI